MSIVTVLRLLIPPEVHAEEFQIEQEIKRHVGHYADEFQLLASAVLVWCAREILKGRNRT